MINTMELNIAKIVSERLKLKEGAVQTVLDLLAEGATIPFIARYRKDKTGALDEVQIAAIQEESKMQEAFINRKIFIEKAITEQGKMTASLQMLLDAAQGLHELEDIYLPYKPKRKTRAQKAKEAGLEPLAEWLMLQQPGSAEEKAASFVQEAIPDTAAALQGARDIIAEAIAEDADLRGTLRYVFANQAEVITKVFPEKEQEAEKYKDYFDFAESVTKIPSHRFLAAIRGFMEGFLTLSIHPEQEAVLPIIHEKFLKAGSEASAHVEKACRDAYRRLLMPALESELRLSLKAKSDEEAIAVFAENLRQLLLSSPLGNKGMIAIDPGYRTGCKLVVLDRYGNLLHHTVIFIHEQNDRLKQAAAIVRQLVEKYKIECFSIGNGTAGRETEQFVRSLQLNLPVFLINEDGASVYSASEIAREEFPEQDITVRGAVSIGRRLMDPLAELVKIDPRSIGVGQYQHDVNPARLKEKLDQTVESCVNAVGVNLNTSGKYLLQYVSGIGPALAENIVRYRNENGGFHSRKELLKVPRLGPSAYQQCAGFLRIEGGHNLLDASGVHPEAYALVEQIAADLNVPLTALMANETLLQQIVPQKYVSDIYGTHTVNDVLKELLKPGRDPRSALQAFEYASVYKIEDLYVGMVLPGIVTNLTRFGAFVDIGIKHGGLVHVSEIANRYITDPAQALKLNQQVNVKVLEVDIARKRIALSIKQALPEKPQGSGKQTLSQKPKQGKPAEKSTNNFVDALANLKRKFN